MMNEAILLAVLHDLFERASMVVFNKVLVFQPMWVGFWCNVPCCFKTGGEFSSTPESVVRGRRME